MWLCTQRGFFSIVDGHETGQAYVRSRHEQDLVNLQTLCGLAGPMVVSEDSDYPVRLIVDKADVPGILAKLGEDINYRNFKSRIDELPDQREKHNAYSGLWSALLSLQRLPSLYTRGKGMIGER